MRVSRLVPDGSPFYLRLRLNERSGGVDLVGSAEKKVWLLHAKKSVRVACTTPKKRACCIRCVRCVFFAFHRQRWPNVIKQQTLFLTVYYDNFGHQVVTSNITNFLDTNLVVG